MRKPQKVAAFNVEMALDTAAMTGRATGLERPAGMAQVTERKAIR
jgi:hypothetical protein